MVLTLRSGVVRTVYVDLRGPWSGGALVAVNGDPERAAGGLTLSADPRDAAGAAARRGPDDPRSTELLNIFMQSAEDVLDPGGLTGADLLLGRTSVLAQQPEFSTGPRLRSLIELTEQKDLLTDVLAAGARQRCRASRSAPSTASRSCAR
jgi:heat-inducible transcriptional repressor